MAYDNLRDEVALQNRRGAVTNDQAALLNALITDLMRPRAAGARRPAHAQRTPRTAARGRTARTTRRR